MHRWRRPWGTEGVCSVQPGAVRLMPGEAAVALCASNCLNARYLDPVYHGQVTRHQLVPGGEVAFAAFQPSSGALAGPAPGSHVEIAFTAADLVIRHD